jgi:hypothetical protein
MKTFIFCAAVAVLCASCTGESFLEETNEIENAQSYVFQREPDYQVFLSACKSIIQTHKDFDYFRELLDESQLRMIDGEKFDIEKSVGIIYIWWSNDQTWDILIEWPAWDDFIANLPDRYFDSYPFCI